MADLIRIKAERENGSSHWSFVDEAMAGYKIKLDQKPNEQINDGDVWEVDPVHIETKKAKAKIAIVRLVAKVQVLKKWQKIKELPDFWIGEIDLQTAMSWLNANTSIMLIGPKGTGKTTFSYKVAEALGWQTPYKVDVYTIKRTTDLFGTDAARDGSTHFIKSGLLDYIERAMIAYREGLDTHFMVILDEINRVHAKANESMHGLFDDTRQVSIITTEGSKTITLPPNIHFVGTMNEGAEYLGTHGIDDALKDRFAPLRLKPMPLDYEVAKLVRETSVVESQALSIVQTANALRAAAKAGQISFAPSFRICRSTGQLVVNGMGLRTAVIKGMLGWYEGEVDIKSDGNVSVEQNTEIAKAYSALRMRGVASQAGEVIAV